MNSDALLQFVVGGGLVAVVGAVVYAYREIRAGKVAARKGDLDSLRDILGEQRAEMADQARRSNERVDELEADLRAAETRARAAESINVALRRHLVRLEGALIAAGIAVPEWQEQP